MEPNIITLTDQYGESVRFELLDIVEYEDQEFAVLYPADGGDDEPVHILRITSENLDLDEMEFEGLDDEDLINAVFDLFCERNDLNKYCNYSVTAVKVLNSVAGHRVNSY